MENTRSLKTFEKWNKLIVEWVQKWISIVNIIVFKYVEIIDSSYNKNIKSQKGMNQK